MNVRELTAAHAAEHWRGLPDAQLAASAQQAALNCVLIATRSLWQLSSMASCAAAPARRAAAAPKSVAERSILVRCRTRRCRRSPTGWTALRRLRPPCLRSTGLDEGTVMQHNSVSAQGAR